MRGFMFLLATFGFALGIIFFDGRLFDFCTNIGEKYNYDGNLLYIYAGVFIIAYCIIVATIILSNVFKRLRK